MKQSSWNKIVERLVCGLAILTIVSSNSGMLYHSEEFVQLDQTTEQQENSHEESENQESFYPNQTLAFSPIIKALPTPILFVLLLLVFNENPFHTLKDQCGEEIPHVFELFFKRCISPQAP